MKPTRASTATAATSGISQDGSSWRCVMVPRVAMGGEPLGAAGGGGGGGAARGDGDDERVLPVGALQESLLRLRPHLDEGGGAGLDARHLMVEPEVERFFLVQRRDRDGRGLVAVVVDRDLVPGAAPATR